MTHINKKTKQTMTDEQKALVSNPEFIKYIESIARTYSKRMPADSQNWFNEFKCEALAAACEVAMRYDKSHNASFSTFCTIYVKGRLAFYISKYIKGAYLNMNERCFAQIVSIESFRSDDDDDRTPDELISPKFISDDDSREQILDTVENLTASLSDHEREILQIRYGLEDNQYEMKKEAERLGLHVATLYRKAAVIVAKISKSSINNTTLI